MKKLNILITFLTFVLFSACGFKVIDQNLLKNFYIEEITLKGDKKINYTIKNKLNSYDSLVTAKNKIKKETAYKFKNIMPDLYKDFTKNN